MIIIFEAKHHFVLKLMEVKIVKENIKEFEISFNSQLVAEIDLQLRKINADEKRKVLVVVLDRNKYDLIKSIINENAKSKNMYEFEISGFCKIYTSTSNFICISLISSKRYHEPRYDYVILDRDVSTDYKILVHEFMNMDYDFKLDN